MEISVIVPCYNSTQMLELLLQKTREVFEQMGIQEYEIVLVNDGSPKVGIEDYLKELVQKYPEVILINLAKNTGQANAQMAALNYTKGNIILNMDDDMQTHPKNIPLLYNKLMEGYDLVLGSYPSKKHSAFRNFLTKADNVFERFAMNKPADLDFTSFWITRRYIVDELIKYNHPYAFMEGLFLRTAGRIANVEVEHFEREIGESGYNFRKLLKLWSNFTNFTVMPLRIAGIFGVFLSFVGFIAMCIVFVQKCLNPGMPAGYASLLCTMLLFFGIVLICMGVIGEYVGRIFMCINHAPQYVVKNVIYGEKYEEKEKIENEK